MPGLGANSTLGIGVTMFLKDQFSGPSNRIRSSAGRLHTDMVRMQQEQLRYARNLNAGLALAGLAATRGIAAAVKQGALFRYEMAAVRAITGATIDQARIMGIEATSLGQKTMFMSQDVASAMRFMGMAGMKYEQIMGNIKAAVVLAGATQSQLGGKGGAADIIAGSHSGCIYSTWQFIAIYILC